MKLFLFIMFAHVAFANKIQAPKNTSVDLNVPVKAKANETET